MPTRVESQERTCSSIRIAVGPTGEFRPDGLTDWSNRIMMASQSVSNEIASQEGNPKNFPKTCGRARAYCIISSVQ